jgi:hypothetical protein
MRMLPVAAIVGAFALGSYVSAQESPTPTPTPKPRYTSEAMRQRMSAGSAAPRDRPDAMNCVLPNGSERALNTTVTVDGRTYRCIEVLDHNFQRRGVAWTPVSSQP